MDCSQYTSRRAMLSGAIAAGFLSIPATAAGGIALSPRERVDAAVSELKAALTAYDPTIAGWAEFLPDPVEHPAKPKNLCLRRFTLTAFHKYYAP